MVTQTSGSRDDSSKCHESDLRRSLGTASRTCIGITYQAKTPKNQCGYLLIGYLMPLVFNIQYLSIEVSACN